MKYPAFLSSGDTIAICAPSQGVARKIEVYEKSLSVLKNEGYCIVETASVRNSGLRSTDAFHRALELHDCFENIQAKAVYAACGGEFMDEILPFVNFTMMANNPKWLCGASDPTNLLFPYTVKYDVATMYGFNAGAYDSDLTLTFIKDNLALLKGKDIIQYASEKYAGAKPWESDCLVFDTNTKWLSQKNCFSVSGRAIGGCIDVLKNLLGTQFDATKEFIQKYQRDGIIWFFDNYGLSTENFYHSLLQMKYAGWFLGKCDSFANGRKLADIQVILYG